MATVPQEEPRSSLSLLRDVVMSLTRVVEDSTELIGASVHEELARFRTELARHALSLVSVMAGAALLSAGLAMLLSTLIGSWPVTLVLFGAAYLGLGFLLGRGLSKTENGSP